MADLEHGLTERYRVRSPQGAAREYDLALDIAKIILRSSRGREDTIAIFVEGWTDPWSLFFDVNGKVRARCPTSPRVVCPLITPAPSKVEEVIDGQAH